MTRSIFINDSDDMDWLQSTHLINLPSKYKSAIIYGNEDWPDKIVVFEERYPEIGDIGDVFYSDKEGKFHLEKENKEQHSEDQFHTRKLPRY